MTPAEVIRGARDRHPAFTEALLPNIIGRRWIADAEKRLLARAIEANPTYLVSTHAVPFTLAVLTDGVTLPDFVRVVGGEIKYELPIENQALDVIPYGQRYSRRPVRSAYTMNKKLFFLGSEDEWAGVTSIDVHYVPWPAALTSDGQTMTLRDDAGDALSAGLAAFFAGRLLGRGIDKAEVRMMAEEAERAEADFVQMIVHPTRARRLMIAEVEE